MTRSLRLLALVAIAGPVIGCGGGIGLSFSPQMLRPGDTVEVTLVNHSAHSVVHNLCSVDLEQSVVEGWQRVPSGLDADACNMSAFTVEAGLERAFVPHVVGSVPDGTYRFHAVVDVPQGSGSSQLDVYSGSLAIRSAIP